MSKPSNVVCEDGVCRIVKPEEAAAAAEATAADASHPIVSLLGPKLKGKDGDIDTASITGAGKVVGLYFSAHWCPPCRGFTPALAEWYANFKAKHANAADFEIVFVSSDRDEAAFDSYYAEMPWIALPFAERALKASVSKAFGVRGIPTLVMLDGDTGDVLTKNGREIVGQDSQGANFPWRPKPLAELLGGKVVNKAGESKELADVAKGKVLGVYFSAHWCPPCRRFTPVLAALHAKAAEQGKDFEVVFVSADKNEAQFKEYLGEMPWWAVPFDERDRAADLQRHFEVEGYPTCVVLEADTWKTITADGVERVSNDEELANFPWRPKAVEDMKLDLESVNSRACCIVFPSADGLSDAERATLDTLAAPHWAADQAKPDSGKLRFLVAPEPGHGLTDRVRHVASVPDGVGVTILNIPEELAYPGKEGESVEDLVTSFLAGGREGKKLEM